MFKKTTIIIIIFAIINLILIPNVLSNEITTNENSGGLFGFRDFFAAVPLITVTYEPLEENVIPNSEVLDITLYTSFKLAGSFRKLIENRLWGMPIQVELSIAEKPDWCDASIQNPTVSIPLDEIEPRQSRLKLTVTEQAPAFQQATVKIKATSKEISGLFFTLVKEGEFMYDIPFEVGYWPCISYIHPKGTLMEIGPSDTADFPIILENLGNGITVVQIELVVIPEGDWNVNVPSSVILASPFDEGTGSEQTVHLVIKPPSFSGNVNLRKDFALRFSPSYLGYPKLKGIEETITFNVQVFREEEGVEEEGVDINLIIILIVVILIIIIISFLIIFKRKFINK